MAKKPDATEVDVKTTIEIEFGIAQREFEAADITFRKAACALQQAQAHFEAAKERLSRQHTRELKARIKETP